MTGVASFPIVERFGKLWIAGDLHQRFTGVYAIHHIRSGRAYIGSAVDMWRRWTEHLNFMAREESPKPLLPDWRLDGPSGFLFVVLEELAGADKTALTLAEQRWLDHYADAPPYNVYLKVWRPREHKITRARGAAAPSDKTKNGPS